MAEEEQRQRQESELEKTSKPSNHLLRDLGIVTSTFGTFLGGLTATLYASGEVYNNVKESTLEQFGTVGSYLLSTGLATGTLILGGMATLTATFKLMDYWHNRIHRRNK